MTKIEMAKAIGELVVSAGVGFIVGGIVKTSVPATSNLIKKGCIFAASAVLTDMISDKTTEHIEKTVDGIENAFIDVVKEVQTKENEEA